MFLQHVSAKLKYKYGRYNIINKGINLMQYIKYKDTIIEYEIQRAKIKNTYIKIKDGNVIVKASNKVSINTIKSMIENKKEWIYINLEKSKIKKQKQNLYSEQEFIEIITKSVSELIASTGLKPNKVKVKELKYAWGSCSNKKNISLNSNLIKYSKNAIEYVILHEFCHMKHMNHSKEFWNMVYSYMPDYKKIKQEFK